MKLHVTLLGLGLLALDAQAQVPSDWQGLGVGPVAPIRVTTVVITPTRVAALPQGRLNDEAVYLLDGNWVVLLSAGEGNSTARRVAAGRGRLVEPHRLGEPGIVQTEAGAVALGAGDVIRYREATSAR